MSILIEGMKLPQHVAVNGEKGTAYKCVILSHPDSFVELVIDSKFASLYDNGHNIQRYPIIEISTPHGRLIDADCLIKILQDTLDNYPNNYNDGKIIERLVVDVYKQFVEHCLTIIEAEVNE